MSAVTQEESINTLSDPLSISDLVSSGARFEINPNFDDEELLADHFDDIDFGSDNEDDTGDFDTNRLISPWQHSYEELRLRMTKINDFIYKNVVRSGNPDKGPVPINARVSIRYNAYWERESAPFDSSFLRGTGHSFYTGRGDVLEGLEAAVRTMCVGEESQFVISYQLLFREMGCPPRIKPKADGLFIIECIDFNVVGDVEATDNLNESDKNDFSKVLAKVKDVHLKGLDFFRQSMYKNACKAFMKAVNALNFCHLKNQEEEKQAFQFLIKLHTNLAVCYNKLNQPGRAMIMCREIKRLTHNKPSSKALFQEGRALLLLGEYSQARASLVMAQRIEPNNTDVNKELKALEDRYNNYKKSERELWKRAMTVIKDTKLEEEKQENEKVSTELQKELENILRSVESGALDSFTLPAGLTPEEIAAVEELTTSFNLRMQQSPVDKTYTLFRKSK